MRPKRYPFSGKTKASTTEIVGKYLEISGELAGRIEAETEKALLVRRAIVIEESIDFFTNVRYFNQNN